MTRALPERDMSAVVAYTRGMMSEPEQIAFELRLAEDPELAELVESFLDGDLVLEELMVEAPPERVLATWPRAWPRWIPLAAAVLLAFLGYRFLIPVLAPPSDIHVAVLESYHRFEGFAAAHQELAGLLPPVKRSRSRGADSEEPEPTNISAADYLERVRALEQADASGALTDGRIEATADFFVLPVSLRTDGTVVVFTVSESRAPERRFPNPKEPEPEQLASSRLSAGDHVLPRPRMQLSRDGESVEYFNGFVVPLRERKLHVFIGFQTEGLGAGDLAEVDRIILESPGSAPGRVADALASAGFDVREVVVGEP